MHHSAAKCIRCRYPQQVAEFNKAVEQVFLPTPQGITVAPVIATPTPAEHVQFDRARKADSEKIKALEAK
jgi:hypothetical protein